METLKTKRLGSADGFTPEQWFFVGWGQTNPHSPGKYRTNGVVSSMPEFAKAFACPVNANMVQQPVCRVW